MTQGCLGGNVWSTVGCRRRPEQFAWIGLGPIDQILNGFVRAVGAHEQRLRANQELIEKGEVLTDVVLHCLEIRRHRERAGRCQRDRIAIRFAARQLRGRDRRARTRFVLDHNRHFPPVAQKLGHPTGTDVARTARCETDQNSHWSGGKFFLRPYSCHDGTQGAAAQRRCQRPQQRPPLSAIAPDDCHQFSCRPVTRSYTKR